MSPWSSPWTSFQTEPGLMIRCPSGEPTGVTVDNVCGTRTPQEQSPVQSPEQRVACPVQEQSLQASFMELRQELRGQMDSLNSHMVAREAQLLQLLQALQSRKWSGSFSEVSQPSPLVSTRLRRGKLLFLTPHGQRTPPDLHVLLTGCCPGKQSVRLSSRQEDAAVRFKMTSELLVDIIRSSSAGTTHGSVRDLQERLQNVPVQHGPETSGGPLRGQRGWSTGTFDLGGTTWTQRFSEAT